MCPNATSSTSEPGPGDVAAGLQAERTQLAWDRTALTLLANAALMGLRLTHSAVPALSWTVVTLEVVLGVAVMVGGRRRAAELSGLGRTRPVPVRLTVLGVAVVVLVLVVAFDLALGQA